MGYERCSHGDLPKLAHLKVLYMSETAVLKVRLTPRGGKELLGAITDGVLHARVAAPPVDGAANSALLRLLAKQLNYPVSKLTIVAGQHSRLKTVSFDGISQESLFQRLSTL